ncbi:MAG: divalent-cation tolerance protein CutA [Theionarchaea archaeon]|nr:divalent-cation tolerance protein CutA [Theionarchaea archaeon]
MEYSLIYMTSGSKREAESIARILLEKRQIACANLIPVSSLYIWKDQLQEDQEYVSILKTEQRKVHDVIEEVKKLHSYEVPDIVEIPLGEGYRPFLQWISEVVQ